MTIARKILSAYILLIGILMLFPGIHSCERFEPESELYFYTDTITLQSRGNYVFSGAIVNLGKDEIIQHGFCWSDSENPTVDQDSSSRLGNINAPGSFSSTVNGLDADTKYYVRVYATIETGTEYSQEKSFSTPAANLPTVSTKSVTNVTANFAQSGGVVMDDGGSSIVTRGVCWSTSEDPKVSDSHTTNGEGNGEFNSSIIDLDPNTTYYVKAYATNSRGTGYGDELSFTTLATTGETVTDYDGNVYNTVIIGDQVWMKENLKTTNYNDGTAIPLVTDPNSWNNLTSPGYCWYNNDEATYKPTYGALYNWYVVNTEKLCPSGWHVPSEAEWTTLTSYLGGYSFAGGKLKEAGIYHWVEPNTGATNESGFTALPGGSREKIAGFGYIGYFGYWWASTEHTSTSAHNLALYGDYSGVYMVYDSKECGFSVRCLRD